MFWHIFSEARPDTMDLWVTSQLLHSFLHSEEALAKAIAMKSSYRPLL